MQALIEYEGQQIQAEDVAFSHHKRVRLPALIIALAVVGGVIALVKTDPSPSGHGVAGSAQHWGTVLVAGVVLVVAVVLIAAQVVGRLRATWARWAGLLTGLAAATYFGSYAGLSGHKLSIFQVEVAGSLSRASACKCDHALETAINNDFAFIAAYTALLVLLVCWAGCYYRLGVVRDARTLMVTASIVAAALDYLEDGAMLLGIHHPAESWWQAAAVCAWAKWVLVTVVVVYIAGGIFSWWVTPRWIRIASWQLYEDARHHADQAEKSGSDAFPDRAAADTKRGAAPAQLEKMTRKADLDRLSVAAPAYQGGAPRRQSFGIALSGGGIRASSISLGALQVLEATENLGWDRAHAVTAVSGGSNMASGWSIARSDYRSDTEGNPDRIPAAALDPRPWTDQDGKATPEEEHLVQNLGYLLLSEPRGSSTDRAKLGDILAKTPAPSYRPAAIATVLSGLAVNTAVLLCVLWVLTRPAGWLLRYLVGPGPVHQNRTDANHHHLLTEYNVRHLVSSGSYALPGVVFLVLGFVLLLLWVVLAQFLLSSATNSRKARTLLTSLKSSSYGALGLGAGLLVLLWGYVELVAFMPHIGSGKALLAALASAAGVAGSALRVLRKPLARFTPMLGGVAFIVVALLLAAVSTWKAAKHGVVWHGFGWDSGFNWLLALGLLGAVQVLVSPERWALAPFYRGKLRSAYATYRLEPPDQHKLLEATPYVNDNADSRDWVHEPSLQAFINSAGQVTTPFVICATATVSTPAVRTHFGTPALSVTFDPAHMTLHFPNDLPGQWSQYQVSTATIDRMGRPFGKRMSTMMAVAIASAAVSPAMGRYRIGPTSMLLTFFNVRLGVWIANPRYVAQLEKSVQLDQIEHIGYARTGLSYLFREFFGWHNLDDPYLYLTDGGHWENTGLVEMLRNPGITEVVCIDADSGPGDAVSSLTKAIKIAQPECGVNIDISLDPLRTTPSTSFAPAYAERAVNVGFFTSGTAHFKAGDPVGILWYSRPALTTATPQRLLAFHEGQQDFPRASTLNQFFDVATFQAYRDLGRESTTEIVEARKLLLDALNTQLLAPGRALSGDQILDQLQTLAEYHWVYAEVARGALAIAGRPLVREFCVALQASLQ